MGKNLKEEINVWRLDDIAGLELRSGIDVSEPYPRHWHEEYQFCLIQAGGGELYYRGTGHDTPSTSLFIVHPGEVHSNHTETGCSFRSIYIEPELIRGIISDAAGLEQNLPFFPNPIIFDKEIIADYLSLHFSRENSDTLLEHQSTMLEMMTKLITRHAEEKPETKAPRKEHKAVKEVREYIIDHHDRNISLEELTRLANLSAFHLTRVFAKEIGMPPHAFQTQVRVAKAKKLIRDGLPLSSVAAMTGFADQSHFIRHFRRLLKITPGEYLKNSKNVQYEIR
jgi:AraC-like DNA-binding protein